MKKLVLMFAAVMTGVLCLPQLTGAQVPVPANTTETPITWGNTTDARNVNCDMIFHQYGSGQLRAIAYDDYNTNTSFIYLEDYAGGTITIPIPGATDIDIAMGDDLSNLGNDYIATVVYNLSGTPMIDAYTITGTGSGSLSVSASSSTVLPMVVGGLSYFPPHIDMYPDMSITVNGIPAMHEYGIVWTEYSAIGPDAYMTNGDNTTFGSFGTVYTVTSGGTGYWPDLACLRDISTNEPFAYVPYINSSSSIDLWEVNLNTTANSVIAPGLNAGMPVNKSVRIEAMNQYNPGPGFQKYAIAFAAFAGGGIMDMFSYNNLTGLTNLSAAGVGLSSGNNIHPAVSAGPGPVFSGGYGSDNYSICWYNDATPFYYSQAIDVFSGNVNGAYPNYYEVNQLPTPFIVLDAYYAPIAVSASSNLGKDELLTAWNNNNDIFYKYQGNILQYKPTSVPAVSASTYQLYPNPAASVITITGAHQASYTITDVTGRVVLNGSLTKDHNTVNIQGLTKGMYTATVKENGANKVLKFVKL